jgi:tryptophan halogenase
MTDDAITELLEQRLFAIVTALDGQNVGADDHELWFQPKDGQGLEIRLDRDPHARCYDRSTNFGVSYGGQPTNAPISSAFREALQRIKAIDDAPIAGAASAFEMAAKAVADRFATPSPTSARVETAPIPLDPPRMRALRSVVVVGGGTAGYFAALALKHEMPDLDVTLIESSKIPIIGVGEATTTLMPPFLHLRLGLDIVELYRDVRPTWKLGIKFDWGLPGDYYFNYPFGDGNPVEAHAHDGHINNQSLCSLMMSADRTPIVTGDDGEPISLLEYMPYAYHLENKCFVAHLQKCARSAGVGHIDAEIKSVVPTGDRASVDRLILDDGREIRADLYVDASGFRALLIEKTLGSSFMSYASSLFCDTAVVAEVPQSGPIEPYTTAQTMDAGWCWRIPVEGEDHRGYVFSSAHLTVDQAREEMRAKNPGMGDTWTVRFRSGRHEEFWKGNTIAVGNAYGFVEPLESTALHMVIMEIHVLLHCLRTADDGRWDRGFANESVALHWDYLRWFLAVHYRFNRKSDSEFWRTCREAVDVSGIEPMLDRFSHEGPIKEGGISPHAIPDPVFNYHALLTMLLGQGVASPPPVETWLSKAAWEARVAESRKLVSRALDQRQALDLLRRRPDLLEGLVTPNSKSWIVSRASVAAHVKVPGFWIGQPTKQDDGVSTKPLQPKEDVVPFNHLLDSVAPPSDVR